MNQEHSAFADATVGGIHKPGGAAVLGECDGTPGAADGTYRGHGIVWDLSSRIWCSTAAAGASTSGDFTVITIHPDLQWKGGDVTWAGAHEFDASVDISGNVALDGDFSVDGTAAFTDASFDGTVDFGDGVAFAAEVSIDGIFKADNTSTEFGGTAGIGLFYDPTIYTGGESITFPNGLIIKSGWKDDADTLTTVTFGTAFPNAFLSAQVTGIETAASIVWLNQVGSTTTIVVRRSGNLTGGFYWMAIGY